MECLREINGHSLLALIVDDNFNDILTLKDESGNLYKFSKLWYKPNKDATYCILKSIPQNNAEEEYCLFYFKKIGNELVLCRERNEPICQAYAKEFNALPKSKQSSPICISIDKFETNKVEYIQSKMPIAGKKAIMGVIIAIYTACLILGILLVSIPDACAVMVDLGICEDISAQAYAITIGTMWLALIPSAGYYFATVSPLNVTKKQKKIIAVITTVLLVITNVVFFIVTYVIEIDGVYIIKELYEGEDFWFIPLSMVFSFVGLICCYALTLFRINPEKIKNLNPKPHNGKLFSMLLHTFKWLLAGILKLVKAILTFKEKQPDIFILLSTLLLTLFAFFTAFIFAIIALALIWGTFILYLGGMIEITNQIGFKTNYTTVSISENGQTKILTLNSASGPDGEQIYSDGVLTYYSDDGGKTVYKK